MTFLGYFYPVFPYATFHVFQLVGSKNLPEANDYNNMYNEFVGSQRGSKHNNGYFFNNSFWYKGEAENLWAFINDFRKELCRRKEE